MKRNCLGTVDISIRTENWNFWNLEWRRRLLESQELEGISQLQKKPFVCIIKLAGKMQSVCLPEEQSRGSPSNTRMSFPITTHTSPLVLDVSLLCQTETMPVVVGEGRVPLDNAISKSHDECILPLRNALNETSAFLRLQLLFSRERRSLRHPMRSAFYIQRSNRSLPYRPTPAMSEVSLITLPRPQEAPELVHVDIQEKEIESRGWQPYRYVFTTTPYSPKSFEVPSR
ncbi:hypothetical protein SJAG_04937 [Schizosaccharomyces japonicus yFS275]|uniref:Uncharacterized protein n=1 Tax=Schizosaccharomyces japonicus (strain yFS275 / FY16936) TaxID=402676 RepID=B6K861_SCHJY|nr:hypothetical protein SJAG_04937 [Schizosaccharomyces japonicus yFS275]EEB09715.1 hypothetical protein SJAG_04937 [Schizosaccharomyces japonicus yFS275]